MADWLTLRAAALEISRRLVSARVDAVEAGDGLLRLGLRTPTGGLGLHLDLRPQMPPVYLAGPVAAGRAGPGAPAQLQVLRRALLGARIEGALAPFGERLLLLCLRGRDRFGDPRPVHVAAEFFGTRPDIVAAEAGAVVFVLHGRRFQTGDTLRLPPLAPAPRHAVRAAGGLTAAQAAYRAARGQFAPAVTGDHPPRLDLFSGAAGASVLDALGAIARAAGEELEIARLRRSLRDRLDRRLSARRRSLSEKEREHAESAGADLLLRQGEALKTALRAVAPGSAEVRLPDPHNPGSELAVPLDPDLSAADNMEALFRRYRKLRARRSRLGGEIAALREELAALEALEDALGNAQTLGDLAALRGAAPDLFDAPGAARRGGSQTKGPLRFLTAGGHELLVGRSAQENERLTRAARSTDLWFHAKDRQGAHCILRPLPGLAVGAPDRLDAALIAAFYSKGRESSHVPVDYTLARHLRKAKGAGPGHFLYDHHETLFVTPDPASIDRIRSRRGSPRF